MRSLAASRPTVSVVGAVAQQLPIRTGVANLVFFHLSIHYGDWRAALDEAMRVLRRDGRCVIWTLGRRHHQQSNLSEWFPSVSAADEDRFPEPDLLWNHLQAIASDVAAGQETETKRWRAADWLAAVEGGFISSLQLVPKDEMAEGLAAFRTRHPDPDEQIEYHVLFDWIAASA